MIAAKTPQSELPLHCHGQIYGIPYLDMNLSTETAKDIEDIVLAAILNFRGFPEIYCSSHPDTEFYRGHRFASHFVGVSAIDSREFRFKILDPAQAYKSVADVTIYFKWNTVVGEDKFATTDGFTASAEVYSAD